MCGFVKLPFDFGHTNDKRRNMAGHARIHKEVDGAWVQVGSAIGGEDSWNFAGHAVAMNGDGKRLSTRSINSQFGIVVQMFVCCFMM
jgi:hypothetical protein